MLIRLYDKDVLIDLKNIIRTIEYKIDNVLPLPPPEGDKLLGNDNELSAAVSPKVIIIKNFLKQH